jgi:hypothetical protein
LAGGRFSEEVRPRVKALGIVEFGFDGMMNVFDVGVGVGAGGWVEALLDREGEALGAVKDRIAVEFGAQVGRQDDLVRIDTVLLEMPGEAFHREGGVGFGQFVAAGRELNAAGEFAQGVLKTGQAVFLHLGPVERDIGVVFGLHLEAGKGSVGGLDGAEVIFTVVAPLGRASQWVAVDDALDGIMAQGQAKLLDEPAGAKVWSLFAQSDDAGFQGILGLVGTGLGRPALCPQASVAPGQEAA